MIDRTAPTVKVDIYKAQDASTKTGSVICSLPNGCDEAFKWTNYGYYFDLSGSSDSLSGIDHYTMRYTVGDKSSVDTSSYSSRTISVGTAYTTVTSNGARRLEFTATDKAGNTSTYVTKNIYIDTVAPNPVIKLYKANSDEKKTGSVLKTIDTSVNTAINSWTNYRHYFDLSSSTDSLSGIKEMKMQINDYGIFATGNTAAGTTDLVTTYDFSTNKYIVVGHSGNRYIRFTIRDKAGNSVVRNIRVYIDLEDPVLSSPKIADRFSSSTTLTYSCGDAMSGFQPFGKSDPNAVESVITELKIKSSSSPVTIRCKDTAGNTSTSKTYRWGANSVCGKNSSGGNKTCWHQ